MLDFQTQFRSKDRVEVADILASCIAFHVSLWTCMQTMVSESFLERTRLKIDTRRSSASCASPQMSSMDTEDVK